jgi:hypothetical protein
VDGRGTTAHFLTGRRRALAGVLAIVLVAGLAVSAFAPNGSNASSHREAPYISTDPNADGTDLYAFVSPDDPSTVTLIANYIPLEEPAGGPNFNTFGDDVRYAFQIDTMVTRRRISTIDSASTRPRCACPFGRPAAVTNRTRSLAGCSSASPHCLRGRAGRRVQRGPGRRTDVAGTPRPPCAQLRSGPV